jgi:hypothetical protein
MALITGRWTAETDETVHPFAADQKEIRVRSLRGCGWDDYFQLNISSKRNLTYRALPGPNNLTDVLWPTDIISAELFEFGRLPLNLGGRVMRYLLFGIRNDTGLTGVCSIPCSKAQNLENVRKCSKMCGNRGDKTVGQGSRSSSLAF